MATRAVLRQQNARSRRQLAEIYDGKAYPLVPMGAGKFWDAEGLATYSFSGASNGILTYREVPSDYTTIGERRDQWTPSRSDLSGASGNYCTPEVPVCWSLVATGDTLVLRRSGFGDRALSPAYADAFTLVDEDEIGSRSMRLVLRRTQQGSIVGFSVSRGRVTGLLFSRTS